MKKAVQFFLPCLLMLPFGLFAQPIINADFENWNVLNFPQEPQLYRTSNIAAIQATFAPNVTKDSSNVPSGKYAVKAMTVSGPDGNIPGAAFTGNIKGSIDNYTFEGGLPFTAMPDSVGGYFKTNITGTDSGALIIVFKRGGTPINYVNINFGGSLSGYTAFKKDIPNFIFPPDSIFVLVISGQPDNTQPGNFVMVDSAYFINSVTPFPNGDFENWITRSLQDPAGWSTPNALSILQGEPSVTRTTDAYNGTYAVSIKTVPGINNNDKIGFVVLGQLNIEDGLEVTGGMPVTTTPRKLTGYYKYAPVGQDSALAGIRFYKFNTATGQSEQIGEYIEKLAPAATYTKFQVDIDLSQQPDTAVIILASSNLLDRTAYSAVGSVLVVDELRLDTSTGAGIMPSVQPLLGVFPNPGQDRVIIQIPFGPSQGALNVTDMSGRTIFEEAINGRERISVDMGSYPPGIYFIRVNTASASYHARLIVSH
ncbi:MAG: T9SS type A sorting domain-containing protein [Bacteroidota bacterium]|nr:T9SS type A sorting domain-containing protein [Bacteroidota bacterium]